MQFSHVIPKGANNSKKKILTESLLFIPSFKCITLEFEMDITKAFFPRAKGKMLILAEFDYNSIMLWPTCVTLNDLQQAVDNSDAD